MGKRKAVGDICRICVQEIPKEEWRFDFTAKAKPESGIKDRRVIVCKTCTGLLAYAISAGLQNGSIDPELVGLKRQSRAIATPPGLVGPDGRPIKGN